MAAIGTLLDDCQCRWLAGYSVDMLLNAAVLKLMAAVTLGVPLTRGVTLWFRFHVFSVSFLSLSQSLVTSELVMTVRLR